MRYIHSWFVLLLAAALLAGGCSKQSKSARHLERAQKFLAAGDYDKAEIEYQNSLRLSPTNQVALRGLSQIYFDDEHILPAVGLINALKKANTNDIETRARAARIYLGLGGAKEAREEANFVLERSPTNEMAMLAFIDLTSTNEIKAATQRIAQWSQKTGDHSVYHSALGFFAAKANDAATSEAEFKKALQLDPKSATAHFGLANLYFGQNKMDLGAAELKAAADLSPIRSARRLRLVEFKQRTGATNDAQALLNEMNTKAPDYLPAWLFKARIAAAQQKTTEALAAIDKILLRNPDHFDALMLRSEVRTFEKRYDQALADLDRLATLAPKSAPIRYRIGATQLAKGDNEKAFASLTQAVALDPKHNQAILLLAELNVRRGQASTAVASLNELLKREPNLVAANYLLSRAYQASGRWEDSLPILQKLIAADPKNPEPLLQAGNALRQLKRNNDARKTFEAALQLDPKNVRALNQLVDLDVAANDFATAERRVQAEIAKNQTNTAPLFLMAGIRVLQKNTNDAKLYLEKIIQIDPGAVSAYVSLAKILGQSGELKAAQDKLEAALKTKPNDPYTMISLAMLHHEAKDYQKARELYEKILALPQQDPRVTPQALNNLAAIFSDQLGQLDRAYELARKAEELQPNNPSIEDTFGWILSRRGEYGLAINLLRESLETFRSRPEGLQNVPEVSSHLAITYYLSGNETDAQPLFEELLKQPAEFPLREEVKKCFDILKIDPAKADASSRALLEKRLAEKPADPAALTRMAAILEKENASDKSIALHEKAIAANPKLAPAMARLAALQVKSGKNSARALELARNARTLAPESPEVADYAARVGLESSNIKDQQWALSLLQDSSARRRGNAETLLDLAQAYFSQGRLSETEVTAKDAVRANPNFAGAAAANRLAEIAAILNDPARAAQSAARIQEMLKADPNFVPALAAQALIQQTSNNASAAIASYEKVLARYPGFGPAIRNLAILTADRANDPKAAEYLAKARELFPADSEIARLNAIATYKKADYNRAVTMLGEVARKNTNDAQVQFYLGMSHAQLKQTQAAKTALTRAMSLQPNAPFVADAKKALSELK